MERRYELTKQMVMRYYSYILWFPESVFPIDKINDH